MEHDMKTDDQGDGCDLNGLLGERYARAYRLRQDGLTYKAIGELLGVSASRACDLVRESEQKLRDDRPFAKVSSLKERTKNALRAAGYETKAEVLSAVKDGRLYPGCAGKNRFWNDYGVASHKQVCEWLELDIDKQKPNEKTIERYIAYLERHGYKVTKLT